MPRFVLEEQVLCVRAGNIVRVQIALRHRKDGGMFVYCIADAKRSQVVIKLRLGIGHDYCRVSR